MDGPGRVGGGFFLSPQLLVWMRTPDDALPYAIAYLRLIFVAMPFVFGSAFLMMVLRGAGDSRTPMLFSLLAVAIDIALNPVLMFGWGPLPKMGIAGSAAATVAANAIGMGAMLAHLYAKKHFLRLGREELGYLRLDRVILASLLRKGLPMGMQMIVLASSGILMISLVNRYGSATTAAYGATMQLWNYIQMPAVAIGMAVSSMAAQNVGAGRWDRVGSVARAGVICNCLMTGTLAIVIYLLDEQALGLFLNEPAAVAIGVHLNAIGVWSFLFFGVSMVLSGVVRATGSVLPPLAILAVALLGLRVPFALALRERWHEDAIWWSFPVGAFASMVLSAAYYRFGGWRRARMLETPAAQPESSPAV
ncbi:MAG: MATE family efflux transporter [Myxococcales bacterium]|nr:MAG: MATE family efflux transporter [Myxococcales bacterium]